VLDLLRPPSPLDATGQAYKDWLHLNFFDVASGAAGLINGSIHGSPTEATTRVIGAALVHHPKTAWSGNVEVRGIDEASIGLASVGLDEVAIGVRNPEGLVEVSARQGHSGLELEAIATPLSPALRIEQRLPFGSGWISWYVVPRLSLEGRLTLEGSEIDLGSALAYHDHNWGRWYWGDDVGWEWTVLPGGQNAATVVFARTTDRAHRVVSEPLLIVEQEGSRRLFSGAGIDVQHSGWFGGRLRRVPGALAALHSDRVRPRLPEEVHIRARDGFDEVNVHFSTEAVAQVIAGDPERKGYGFLHELVGSFRMVGRVGGTPIKSEGPGVFEYVC